MASGSQNSLFTLYKSVVQDVVSNVREAFLDEGVDEQVLVELKQLWMSKLHQSKAVDGGRSEQEHMLNVYGSNSALLHQARQSHVQQPTQARQQQILQQQQQQQQQQLQQTVQQQQLPTAVLNSQVSGGGDAGENGATAAVGASTSGAPTTVQAAASSLYPQQLASLQGGQIITLNTPNGQAQFLVQPGSLPQGGTVQLSAAQIQQAMQTQQQQQQQHQQQQATAQLSAQQQATLAAQLGGQKVVQLDGAQDSSSDENDDDDEEDDNDDKDDDEPEDAVEEEPLNSADDVSDEEDPNDLFDTDNVVVCQYDKINRTRNKWRFTLKDGIMNLKGKDFVFLRANGDAEW